jgi:hypothetical protein
MGRSSRDFPTVADRASAACDDVIIRSRNVNKTDVSALAARTLARAALISTPPIGTHLRASEKCVSLGRVRAPRFSQRVFKDPTMTDAAFGEDTRMRMEALRRQVRLRLPPPVVPGTDEGISIRRLRGATEYRGRRDGLIASGHVVAEWLPPERVPGQRTRATLRARDGGRDVFARRLDDGRLCVLVIHTPIERATQDRFAFERFLRKLITRR